MWFFDPLNILHVFVLLLTEQPFLSFHSSSSLTPGSFGPILYRNVTYHTIGQYTVVYRHYVFTKTSFFTRQPRTSCPRHLSLVPRHIPLLEIIVVVWHRSQRIRGLEVPITRTGQGSREGLGTSVVFRRFGTHHSLLKVSSVVLTRTSSRHTLGYLLRLLP